MKDKAVVSRTPETVKINLDEVPKHQMDTICRVVLSSAKKAFENPKFATDYEAWRTERRARGRLKESSNKQDQ